MECLADGRLAGDNSDVKFMMQASRARLSISGRRELSTLRQMKHSVDTQLLRTTKDSLFKEILEEILFHPRQLHAAAAVVCMQTCLCRLVQWSHSVTDTRVGQIGLNFKLEFTISKH